MLSSNCYSYLFKNIFIESVTHTKRINKYIDILPVHV